ncbi:hypothetical protein PR048_005805 [Dryococelus australis]|uniref:Uncharacterized protein n=1 Tax=Dryococelus australis TaxID=614101 RepID=A0ABQ9I982_9NEOP|nr:hypothetical protein PR048_005805 [Dryococelus australis]
MLHESWPQLLIWYSQECRTPVCYVDAKAEFQKALGRGSAVARRWDLLLVKRVDYGVAPECNGGGIGRSPKKPIDQWHRPPRSLRTKIRELHSRESIPVRLELFRLNALVQSVMAGVTLTIAQCLFSCLRESGIARSTYRSRDWSRDDVHIDDCSRVRQMQLLAKERYRLPSKYSLQVGGLICVVQHNNGDGVGTQTGFDSRRGHVRIFACGNCARRCRSSARFLPPFHSDTAPFPPRFILIGSQDIDRVVEVVAGLAKGKGCYRWRIIGSLAIPRPTRAARIAVTVLPRLSQPLYISLRKAVTPPYRGAALGQQKSTNAYADVMEEYRTASHGIRGEPLVASQLISWLASMTTAGRASSQQGHYYRGAWVAQRSLDEVIDCGTAVGDPSEKVDSILEEFDGDTTVGDYSEEDGSAVGIITEEVDVDSAIGDPFEEVMVLSVSCMKKSLALSASCAKKSMALITELPLTAAGKSHAGIGLSNAGVSRLVSIHPQSFALLTIQHRTHHNRHHTHHNQHRMHCNPLRTIHNLLCNPLRSHLCNLLRKQLRPLRNEESALRSQHIDLAYPMQIKPIWTSLLCPRKRSSQNLPMDRKVSFWGSFLQLGGMHFFRGKKGKLEGNLVDFEGKWLILRANRVRFPAGSPRLSHVENVVDFAIGRRIYSRPRIQPRIQGHFIFPLGLLSTIQFLTGIEHLPYLQGRHKGHARPTIRACFGIDPITNWNRTSAFQLLPFSVIGTGRIRMKLLRLKVGKRDGRATPPYYLPHPTKANWIQSLTGLLPDFDLWEIEPDDVAGQWNRRTQTRPQLVAANGVATAARSARRHSLLASEIRRPRTENNGVANGLLPGRVAGINQRTASLHDQVGGRQAPRPCLSCRRTAIVNDIFGGPLRANGQGGERKSTPFTDPPSLFFEPPQSEASKDGFGQFVFKAMGEQSFRAALPPRCDVSPAAILEASVRWPYPPCPPHLTNKLVGGPPTLAHTQPGILVLSAIVAAILDADDLDHNPMTLNDHENKNSRKNETDNTINIGGVTRNNDHIKIFEAKCIHMYIRPSNGRWNSGARWGDVTSGASLGWSQSADSDEPVVDVGAGAKKAGNIGNSVLGASADKFDGSIENFVCVAADEVDGSAGISPEVVDGTVVAPISSGVSEDIADAE